MIPFETAKEILLKEVSDLANTIELETVPLWEAGGRILAETVIANENVPFFDRSPVDGYALTSTDTVQASFANPLSFKIIDTIAAGIPSDSVVTSGTTMKIMTGAPLPSGADCVIKKELCSLSDCAAYVQINRPVLQGEGVALQGEDILKGEQLFQRGTRLAPAHIGILATLGIDPVPVYKKPQIGIFSTGDELIDTHMPAQPGKLRASNLYTLAEMIREAGGEPVNLGIINDTEKAVVATYEKAKQLQLPIVISTGGTASGDFDVTKGAMSVQSSNRLFNKVAMRPGAPVVVTRTDKQLLIGLSGNPAGASVAMLLLIYPLIRKLVGSNDGLVKSLAKLTAPIIRKGGLRGFLWGQLHEKEGQLYVTPFENQFCGAIKTHASSNCLIEVAAGKTELYDSDSVPIWKL